MFKPDTMSEINIIFQRNKLKDVIDILYEQELIEFFDVNNEDFERFDHEDLNQLSGELLKIRSCITILKKYFKKDIGGFDEEAVTKTIELKNNLDEVNKELMTLQDEHKRSKILKNLELTKEQIKSKNCTIGFTSESKLKSFLHFRKIKVKYKTYKKDGRIYFFAETKEIPFTYKEFYLPKNSEGNLKEKIIRTENKIKRCEIELRRIANNNLEHLRFKEHKLRKDVEVIESKPKFSTTKNITIVSGFVPKKSVHKFESTIKDVLDNKCEIIIKEPKDTDEVPIQLSNPATVGNFEEILRLYSLPKYGEFDPTMLIFLVFPIFFGFILGDVVYGLIALIFFSVLRLKFKKIKNFLSILQISSISSIIFGWIYGEFIGFEFHSAYYGWFARTHEPEMLLAIAVIFGLIHINLGLIIGMVNAMPNWRKALYDKVAYMILQISVLCFYLGFTYSASIVVYLAWALLALALYLIYKGHGMIGIMEVPSFFTNILSYARLMAVGLSSVAIALLINEFTLVFFEMGVLGIIAGIVLFSIGHVFNICLGCFEGFLHTLRLHYVEFFTKFYDGGGKEFKPFGKKTYE